ncbi:hypothetical protein DES36_10463 [Alkalibaculum bacchi]|uniref:Uncharacterized protein n=1 Tax=Alkalibaculum bacchi TaxID=645887 RepID=A0A366ICK4_9FIRM|nr:hypothetical protein [Alkalibaculum bacchi]RBP67363.1 hypothetical protein DES36_10463 [Alkalibaculum bacchi]
MANVRKTITASLGSLNDKDLFDFLEQMESKGVTVSKLVKDALRYYQANYISNKKKQKNDIDYNRIESIVEKTVKKVLEEADIAGSLALNSIEQTDTIEAVNPQVKSVKQEAKLPKGKQIKSVKEAPRLEEEQKPAEIEPVELVEESPLTTIEAVGETKILEEGPQVEQEVEKTESQLDREVSIEASVEVITTEETIEKVVEKEMVEEETIEEEQKEEMIEDAKEESPAEKEEVDNSDLEALVSGMITIR